ncbi:hypothetical protein C7B76_23430 [filamentous cyanobacterium CCP2]|nr:hypothetical protein C7B76_23430 [filamentous cyanobacterium CCP2]
MSRVSKWQGFQITSPQGDGNLLALQAHLQAYKRFQITSPKGDGNAAMDRTSRRRAIELSSLIPREGTETKD